MQKFKRVVLILSDGHTGSTLIDLVLASHPENFGLGEIESLPNRILRGETICSVDGKECFFWTGTRINKFKGFIIDSIKKKVLRKLKLDKNLSYGLYKNLFSETAKNILIDSSKKIGWVKTAIRQLRKSEYEPLLIYLKRDPRAVINSWLRKYPNRGIIEITNRHYNNMIRMDEFFINSTCSKISITYEEITSNPETSFKNLFEFIGLNFKSIYLDYWKFDHHQIGGNSGTKSLIKNYRSQKSDLGLREDQLDYYTYNKLAIKPDLRWHKELSKSDAKFIEDKFTL